ncbi:hypothetical protein Ddye_020727 [Dipteronia dyeriana]|uniref:Uncharacterized protein n=1 Tax=Dipteronia dyeriana TaxID=168575 RepID=A0AAD9U0G6_9ROSI|nr:hypothetical protein Ddye_020727 [Dipteronia dyeriana]
MMSNMRPLLSSAKALKRQIRRMEKNKGKKVITDPKVISIDKDKAVDSTEPVTLVVDKSRKCPRSDEPSSDSVIARFPMDISIYFDLELMLKGVDQLLFQNSLHSNKGKSSSRLGTHWCISEKVFTLSSSNTKLKKEVDKARSGLERFVKDLSEKLTRVEDDNDRLRATLRASEKKLSDSDEMLVDTLEK